VRQLPTNAHEGVAVVNDGGCRARIFCPGTRAAILCGK